MVHHRFVDGFADRRFDSTVFMGDIVGRLFREFAVTLAVTILVSAVVSLTLTPMMSAPPCLSRKADQARRSRFYPLRSNF